MHMGIWRNKWLVGGKFEVFEVMYLRNVCGIRRKDNVNYSLIRDCYGCEGSVVNSLKQNVSK